ncbi:MAG: hypothetical protein AAF989_16455, partial [Planctomycetota bacterium]
EKARFGPGTEGTDWIWPWSATRLFQADQLIQPRNHARDYWANVQNRRRYTHFLAEKRNSDGGGGVGEIIAESVSVENVVASASSSARHDPLDRRIDSKCQAVVGQCSKVGGFSTNPRLIRAVGALP